MGPARRALVILYPTSKSSLPFHARERLYAWECEPAELDDLAPEMKVYVNSERSTLKTRKSYEELQREVEQLRRTVEQLQQKVKQLEADGKSK
jgi:hypothetical protein